MSIKKFLALTLLMLIPATSRSEDSSVTADDPVLHYYWEKARRATRHAFPQTEKLEYSCSANLYLHRTGSDGHLISTDSLHAVYFFSGGSLDSQRTISGKSSLFPEFDPFYPDVFEGRYERHLFPNDTGGIELAIGLISDSAATDQPDGLLVIDREQFLPRRIYLYYPKKPGFRRFTRTFKLAPVEGYLFAVSILEMASRSGILKSENYRLETTIYDITITAGKRPGATSSHQPESVTGE